MDASDPKDPANYRTGDGGKWRNHWKENPVLTYRVFATLVEELIEGKVKSRGARAHDLWEEF